MNLIAAADRNWGIGKDGGLLFHLKKDMKYFKEKTSGHTIVLGRKTLDSFPGGRPLPQRRNIVLTRDETCQRDGVIFVHSLDELFALLQTLGDEEVWVSGGGNIYELLLPWCRYAYITKVDEVCQADTCMPNLDREPGWVLKDEGETMEEGGRAFSFTIYENTCVRPLGLPADGEE